MAIVAKYPDSTKTSLEQRLAARARERWPQIASLHIRHRGTFSYIDATLTDATTLKLCRLRYVGSAHQWQFAIYRASHDDYEKSVLPSGYPAGTPQEAHGRDGRAGYRAGQSVHVLLDQFSIHRKPPQRGWIRPAADARPRAAGTGEPNMRRS